MIARLRGIFLVTFWFTAIALFAIPLIALRLITGNEYMIYSPVRLFVRMGLKMAGVRVAVRGLEHLVPGQAYIFTPNHQSFIEVPLLVTYLKRNPGYLAKKEVFKYPVFGYGISLMGVVPVDRSNTQTAVESARLATRNLRAGKDYVVYPEGTRSRDGRLLPFKKGAFLMAIDAGVPVVPISISGSTRVMPKGEFKVYPGTIHITVHEPMDAANYSRATITEFMENARAKVASGLVAETESATL